LRLAVSVTAIAAAAALALSACSTGASGAGPSDSSAPLTTPKITLSDATQASFVNVKYGPVTNGATFGIPMTLDDFTAFDSNQTATQAVLSGQAQIVGTSLMGTLAAQAAGADLKTFCPYVNQDDLVLVGRNGVNSIDQLFNGTTRVALDSPGGAADEVLNAILLSKGDSHTTKDIKGVNVLESAGLRQSAWGADQVDATIIHQTQYNQIKDTVPDATIIATLYKDVPLFVKNTYAAPSSWLDANLDTAAAFCAATLLGNAQLAGNEQTFLGAVKTYIDSPPSQTDLDSLWNEAKTYSFWPTGADGGLGEPTMDFMAKVGVASGVIDTAPSYADMVDQRPLQMAAKLIAALPSTAAPTTAG
jgi:NitT/TauT family transport system substrate-binding protein